MPSFLPSAITTQFRRRWKSIVGGILLVIVAAWYFEVPGKLAKSQGDRLAKDGRLLHADLWYQQADAWGNDSADLAFQRARLARQLSRSDEFVTFLELAQKRGASFQKIRVETLLEKARRGDLQPLESELGDLLIAGDDADEICLAYVQGCLVKYFLDEAERFTEVWQADYPDDPRPHVLRGRILEHRADYQAAEQEFLKALGDCPHSAVAAYNLARVLEAQQRPQEALKYYEDAERDLGHPVPGMVGQGRCLRLLQRNDEAIAKLEKAKAQSSDQDIEAFRVLGDPAESSVAKVHEELGYALCDAEQFEAAIPELESALQSDQNNWRARYQLALAQRQSGLIDNAQENLHRVEETKQALATCDRLFDQLHKDPTDTAARLKIGQVFLEHLSENQGLVWLDSVLNLEPNNVEAHRTLCEYFRKHTGENPSYQKLADYHCRFVPDSDAQTEN